MKRRNGNSSACALACVAVIAVAGPAAGQGNPDVRVNQDPPGAVTNETSLALNLTQPGNMVIAFNDHPYPGGPGLGVATTTDWGITWTHQNLLVPLVDAFDPVVVSDTRGYFWVGQISTANPSVQSGVFVQGSIDGGATWPLPIATVVYHDPVRFNDKPHMAVDTSPSPWRNSLYVVWINEPGGGPWSDIYFAFARAIPVAPYLQTFGLPQQISDLPTGVGMGNGPNTVVAADGTIYVVWLDTDVTTGGQVPGTIYLDHSIDGGVTWGQDMIVHQVATTLPNNLHDHVGALDAKARSYPCMAVSPSSPREIYVVWAEDPDGAGGPDEGDIFFTRSVDGGNTFRAPQNLSDPATAPFDQFEPWIAVKGDGTIDVAWYEKGYNDSDKWWDVVIRKSINRGNHFGPPFRITDTAFQCPTVGPGGPPWMGEYLALEVDATTAYVGFTSSVTDLNGDVFFDFIDNALIPTACGEDLSGNNQVDFADILVVIGAWGPCPPVCPEDLNLNGSVDFADILAVIGAWGPCP
ncbi:MAG: hypothetical protein GY715_18770 [Planctomycetes bacterium]|nr:hypothetical protein [Planctomycetota bacterium]